MEEPPVSNFFPASMRPKPDNTEVPTPVAPQGTVDQAQEELAQAHVNYELAEHEANATQREAEAVRESARGGRRVDPTDLASADASAELAQIRLQRCAADIRDAQALLVAVTADAQADRVVSQLPLLEARVKVGVQGVLTALDELQHGINGCDRFISGLSLQGGVTSRIEVNNRTNGVRVDGIQVRPIRERAIGTISRHLEPLFRSMQFEQVAQDLNQISRVTPALV
jgi:hypothetical protein